MPLNKVKGNMYGFVTHTWNTVKGICPHGCQYCYMSKRGKLNPVRLDTREFKTDLGTGNTIFVGSSCDMWAEAIPDDWILATLFHMKKFPNNTYFFQSKNPSRFFEFMLYLNFSHAFQEVIFCTTVETNRVYPQMGSTLSPLIRTTFMKAVSEFHKTHITIEPIMDFDLKRLLMLIKRVNPVQVNIGADSKGCKLPEPSPEKLNSLIQELRGLVPVVYLKPNLKRLL